MAEGSKIKMRALVVGPISTNCYLILNTETNEIILIDPGDESDRLIYACESAGGKPAAILLTHGHMDHILAIEDIRHEYPDVKVYASEKEKPLLTDPSLNAGLGHLDYTIEPDVLLKDGEEIEVCGLTFRVLLTPGHTAGSVCYYLPDVKVLFAGDTLFRGSYGRTDFPTGSQSAMIKSIQYLTTFLPGEVNVLPGHGPATTIAAEKIMNPALT